MPSACSVPGWCDCRGGGLVTSWVDGTESFRPVSTASPTKQLKREAWEQEEQFECKAVRKAGKGGLGTVSKRGRRIPSLSLRGWMFTCRFLVCEWHPHTCSSGSLVLTAVGTARGSPQAPRTRAAWGPGSLPLPRPFPEVPSLGSRSHHSALFPGEWADLEERACAKGSAGGWGVHFKAHLVPLLFLAPPVL